MAFDGKKDLATGTVLTAPSPATSGTSLVLQSGEGARMPTAPFDAIAHPDGSLPTIDNAEKVRVTGKSTDTLTIVRAQGVTTAKSIATSWRITAAIFSSHVTDIEAALTAALRDSFPTGCVWSGDAYASTRVASMTAGTVIIAGRDLTIAAVTSRTFTASKDTYVDARDNGDGTALLIYTEVANNAASPSLTAGDVRMAIIITGASNIASVASINQGQETKVLPIASSVPYCVVDSLGNMICLRSPISRMLGYRQTIGTSFTTTSATDVQITGMSMPIIIPTGRKAILSLKAVAVYNNTDGDQARATIWDGTVSSGTQLSFGTNLSGAGARGANPSEVKIPVTLSGSKTINGGLRQVSGGTAQWEDTGGGASAKYIMAELD